MLLCCIYHQFVRNIYNGEFRSTLFAIVCKTTVYKGVTLFPTRKCADYAEVKVHYYKVQEVIISWSLKLYYPDKNGFIWYDLKVKDQSEHMSCLICD